MKNKVSHPLDVGPEQIGSNLLPHYETNRTSKLVSKNSKKN